MRRTHTHAYTYAAQRLPSGTVERRSQASAKTLTQAGSQSVSAATDLESSGWTLRVSDKPRKGKEGRHLQ